MLGKEPPEQMLPCKAEGSEPASCCRAARQAGKGPSKASEVIQSSHIIWRELHPQVGGHLQDFKTSLLQENSQELQHYPTSGQWAEVQGCFISTSPLIPAPSLTSPSSYSVSDKTEAFWLLESSSCLFTLFSSWP